MIKLINWWGMKGKMGTQGGKEDKKVRWRKSIDRKAEGNENNGEQSGKKCHPPV